MGIVVINAAISTSFRNYSNTSIITGNRTSKQDDTSEEKHLFTNRKNENYPFNILEEVNKNKTNLA